MAVLAGQEYPVSGGCPSSYPDFFDLGTDRPKTRLADTAAYLLPVTVTVNGEEMEDAG